MRRATVVTGFLLLLACQKELTPAEKAAQDRAECQALATQQSGFDPLTADAPPRTVSTTQRRGGQTLGSGAIAKGAAEGAVAGVIGGAIMGDAGRGAGAGAAIGGLFGGVKRHRETNEMVTRTHTNPAYEQFMQSKQAFNSAFEGCLAARQGGGAQ